jgi:hypothetical protein
MLQCEYQGTNIGIKVNHCKTTLTEVNCTNNERTWDNWENKNNCLEYIIENISLIYVINWHISVFYSVRADKVELHAK